MYFFVNMVVLLKMLQPSITGLCGVLVMHCLCNMVYVFCSRAAQLYKEKIANQAVVAQKMYGTKVRHLIQSISQFLLSVVVFVFSWILILDLLQLNKRKKISFQW